MKRIAFLLLLLSLAAPASLGAPWRMVVTGDSRGADGGVNAEVLSAIVAATVAEKPDLVLFSGDLVSGYTDEAAFEAQMRKWRDIMAPVYDAGIGVLAVRGNHDAGAKNSAAVWNRLFTGALAFPANGPAGEENMTFSLRHKNALIIGLDQSVSANRVNKLWLDTQLSGQRPPHLFVMGHVPAFKVGHKDTLDNHATERDGFWSALRRAGARAYFCGHDHFYDHMRVDDHDGNPGNDLHQYIVGSAGAPLYADGPYDGYNSMWRPVRVLHDRQYGYLLVEVDDSAVTMTWKSRQPSGAFAASDDVFRYSVRN